MFGNVQSGDFILRVHTQADGLFEDVYKRQIQGCSYDEIADILGTNVGTIKSRISRARARLREILSAQMELFDRTSV